MTLGGFAMPKDPLGETSILQISDLHFGPPFLSHVADSLLKTAASLRFDAVVVSGDVTQRAKRDQFAAADEFLQRLSSAPRLVVPGNHDVPLYNLPKRLLDPHGNYREFIDPDLNPILSLPGATIVGLDSTAPRSAISNGRIHSWQLEYCASAFAAAPPQNSRIVVAHHHFVPAPDNLNDSSMRKTERAMRRFVELGVDVILGGHLHRAYIGNSLDFYPGSHRERGIVIAHCGTSTSRRGRGREREKNTFNLITLSRRRVEITHYMYFHDSGFLRTSSHEFFRQEPLPRSAEQSLVDRNSPAES